MRPSDLAHEHGISTQSVRNHERDGFIPPAERTRSGHRIYTEVHAAALRAHLFLVRAYGHPPAGRIMHALHEDRLDDALAVIDHGHERLLRDRATLAAVRESVDHLTAGPDTAPGRSPAGRTRTIGELAHRLGVTPATLRNWEDVGILVPERDPATGYRVFRAEDVRDAELAHLLRRGGYPLDHVRTVVGQVRTAGGTDALFASLSDWRRRLTAQGLAMLDAAAHLSRYLVLLDLGEDVRADHSPRGRGTTV
ncbi:TioE family transcriptional regulator [Nocardiopsis lambiniae]|uniref:TioE family transcriptional regulator n=1 Tax=Nocardiopsis lambiniae TaxID=3075539 RepID=A0ABU2M7B4_9ACTN|nr:TioE family transcriptional regulator [Nocardiopsis sp. DSM 44743]MDT0328494.1 TioE family transcriptional regulator [Nocardiopsis sp. DSM 44743]